MPISVMKLQSDAFRIVDLLYDTEGEITEALEAQIEALSLAGAEKAAALYYVRQRIDAEIELLGAEARRLSERRASLTRARERIGELAILLHDAMRGIPGATNAKGHLACGVGGLRLRVQHSKPYLRAPEGIDDWPPELVRERVVREPNKEGAREALEAGRELPGFELRVTPFPVWW